MIAPEKDGEFLGREDPPDRFPNDRQRDIFLSEGELQVPHIVETQLAQISLHIRTVGFDPPGGPPDCRWAKTSPGTKGGCSVKGTSQDNRLALRKGGFG